MTNDALTQGNLITAKIQARQALLMKHSNIVKQHMSELSAADQSAVISVLTGIHTPVVTTLQGQLTALSGDYTSAPVQSSTTTVS